MVNKREVNDDGLEKNFATNTLGKTYCLYRVINELYRYNSLFFLLSFLPFRNVSSHPEPHSTTSEEQGCEGGGYMHTRMDTLIYNQTNGLDIARGYAVGVSTIKINICQYWPISCNIVSFVHSGIAI